MEGEIRSFTEREKKAKRIHVLQTSITRHAKGIALEDEGKKRERERGTQVQRGNNGNE